MARNKELEEKARNTPMSRSAGIGCGLVVIIVAIVLALKFESIVILFLLGLMGIFCFFLPDFSKPNPTVEEKKKAFQRLFSVWAFCFLAYSFALDGWVDKIIAWVIALWFFSPQAAEHAAKKESKEEKKKREQKELAERVAKIVAKTNGECSADDYDYDSYIDLDEELCDDDVHYMDEIDMDMENWEAGGAIYDEDLDDLDTKRQKLRRYRCMQQRKQKREEEEKREKAQISEEYFNDVNSYVTAFFDFATQLAADKGFMEHCNNLEHINIQFTDSGNTFGDLDTSTQRGKLLFIMLIDLVRNLEHAGHKLNLWEKEQFGILLYLYRMEKDNKSDMSPLEYELVNIFYNEKSIRVFEDFIRQILAWPQVDEVFYISYLLNGYSDELRKKYHIMMYRIISLTAKCDGVVDEQEAAWMEEIMKQFPGSSVAATTSGSSDVSTADANNTSASTAPLTFEEAVQKLNDLIGLSTVKREVSALANLIKIQQRRKEEGLKVVSPSYHCVFTGNPGTGKTTVARILADIYRSLGILEKGHLVETDRSGLVAEYVGQTAVKTNKIIDRALDGVLFIDEAYTLVEGGDNDFGREAIATLLKRMEDDRKRLVVILAGYTDEMKQFIDSNPGLQSRFNRYIEFPDYNADELFQIFESNAARYDYQLTAEARDRVADVLADAVASKDKNFGNARFVRNLFDKTVERQSCRLAVLPNVSVQQLSVLTVDDIAKH